MYDGLVYLHSKCILYRDCKPENTLIKGDGYVMLSDFGVSEQLGSPEETRRGRAGTRVYMPPEALAGERYGLGFDWWCFGISLYELLTNTHPQFPQHSESRLTTWRPGPGSRPESGVNTPDSRLGDASLDQRLERVRRSSTGSASPSRHPVEAPTAPPPPPPRKCTCTRAPVPSPAVCPRPTTHTIPALPQLRRGGPPRARPAQRRRSITPTPPPRRAVRRFVPTPPPLL